MPKWYKNWNAFLKRFVIVFKMVATAVATLPPKVPAMNVNVSLRSELQNFVQNIKTFQENWDSKAPSVGTLLAYLETTA